MTVNKGISLVWLLLASVLVSGAWAEDMPVDAPATATAETESPAADSAEPATEKLAKVDPAVKPTGFVAQRSTTPAGPPIGNRARRQSKPARMSDMTVEGTGVRPGMGGNRPPSRQMASPAGRPAGPNKNKVAQAQFTSPAPTEPIGFSGAKAQFNPGGPSGPVGAFAGSGPSRGTYYMAEQPNPSEPLGFSESRYQPGSPVDPSINPGIFEDDGVEIPFDSMDPDAPAPAVSSGDWVRNGCWYMQQSAVYMSRSVNVKNSARLATDFSSSLNAHDRTFLQIPLAMGYQPGWRATIGKYIDRDNRNRDHSVNFTYMGLTHWQAGESLTARVPGSIFSDIDPTLTIPAFNGSSFQGFTQTSDFNSFEFNYRIDRRPTRDRLIYSRDSCWVREATPTPLPSLFGGIRVVSVNETLNYNAIGAAPVASTGSYNIITHNNMVGLQAGTDWFFERAEWRLGASLKGGGLVNWASQSSVVRILDSNGTPLLPNRNEFADDHTLAFVGELGFIGNYQFRPNFGFRASYNLMWVTNLAIAQNQINFAPSNPIQISDQHSLFYQGFTVGLEWTR